MANAICLLSGDHVDDALTALSKVSRRTSPEPSAFITQSSKVGMLLVAVRGGPIRQAKRMRVPSGDQSGPRSSRSCVIALALTGLQDRHSGTPDPSALMT